MRVRVGAEVRVRVRLPPRVRVRTLSLTLTLTLSRQTDIGTRCPRRFSGRNTRVVGAVRKLHRAPTQRAALGFRRG